MVSTVVLAVVLFASTNTDDFVVLLCLFADRGLKPAHVALGQFLGLSILVLASLASSSVVRTLDPGQAGLLGLVPVCVGVTRLIAARRGRAAPAPRSSAGSTATVAAATVANGGDNLGVYTPVFAVEPSREIWTIGATFAVLTVVWLVLAHAVVNHPKVAAPLQRHGDRIGPFVLIAVGLAVSWRAGSFAALARAFAGG